MSRRTPLKAKRFENSDDFLLRISKKMKRETTPQLMKKAIK